MSDLPFRDIDDAERLAVIDALAVAGIYATHEWNGVVCIRFGDDKPEAWTGMHSWTYGSWTGTDGEPMDDEPAMPVITDAEDDPKKIAQAWADVAKEIRS